MLPACRPFAGISALNRFALLRVRPLDRSSVLVADVVQVVVVQVAAVLAAVVVEAVRDRSPVIRKAFRLSVISLRTRAAAVVVDLVVVAEVVVAARAVLPDRTYFRAPTPSL